MKPFSTPAFSATVLSDSSQTPVWRLYNTQTKSYITHQKIKTSGCNRIIVCIVSCIMHFIKNAANMKLQAKHLFNPAALIVAIVSVIISSCASRLPAKPDVLQVMDKTNTYFMNLWPDAGANIPKPIVRPSNIWTRAVYYEGVMAMYAINPQKKYYDYALEWGVKHKWNLRGGIGTRNADNQCCGQTYIDLYNIDKKPEYIFNIKASIDSMMRTQKVDDWSWIDAIQMAMPVFTQLGVLYKDTAYFDRMYKMYAFSKYKHGGKGLFNPEDNLWWRDKDFVAPYKEPNGDDCYWSRGNGWVVAALVRVLKDLPKNETHREEYLNDLKVMLKALLPLQRADGYWNVSLADSTHFGGKELSGTALFVYGMAWGINNKIIDKKTYQPVLLKAWNAMVKECVHDNGFLGYVQGTGKEPKDGQPVSYTSVPDFEDYGLGAFLLAGSEVYKLKK
jgi:unsaturated rhamnogalacturonyl hydrolase